MTRGHTNTVIGATHTVLSKDGTTISSLYGGGEPSVLVIPGFLSMSALLDQLRAILPNPIVGSPEQVVEQIRAFERVGCEELMAQWFTLDNYTPVQITFLRLAPMIARAARPLCAIGWCVSCFPCCSMSC